MMISIFSFTKNGYLASKKIKDALSEDEVTSYTYEKFTHAEDIFVDITSTGLRKVVKDTFLQNDTLIFVGAMGIVIRSIAPFIRDKFIDPAVLVVDEKIEFVIPVLSGHVGGANAIAKKLSYTLGARAVLTTATDVQDVFAVDTWSKKHHLCLTDRTLAKYISANLLDGKRIEYSIDDFYSSLYLKEDINQYDLGEEYTDVSPYRFMVSHKVLSEEQKKNTLQLIPKNIILGIGCKKYTPAKALSDFVYEKLAELDIDRRAIAFIASIDLKKDEVALLSLAEEFDVEFITYPAKKLEKVEGKFSSSAFVKQTTGVDNICERAVMIEGVRLLAPKVCATGMTLAVAELDIRNDRWKKK